MCGRFSLARRLEELEQYFEFVTELDSLDRRYNIAPTQSSPVIAFQDGVNVLKMMRWGLIPHWAQDEKIGYKMINARAEGIEKKPSFKVPFRKKRCLVIADGFYEWDKRGKKAKVPYRFTLKSGDPFAFAGLWDSWRNPEGKGLETFTIITTDANELITPLHNRMPVMLHPEDYPKWINPEGGNLDELKALLVPFPPNKMIGYEVSTVVNSPKNDSTQCIAKVGNFAP